ncbi:MAG: ATP-binding cassette domain-containing protein [Candidatus Aureabacteria bacterium]|nr:ATP-binding cassette domain-containing protein [Candidatus Auribacterota bacterium]
MIRVKDVSKSFGRIQALDSVSFQIEKGEVVGLLGPNGAGKTTAMRILTSFLSPDGGEVFIKGKSLFPHSEESKSLIGYLPEDTPLYSNMSVDEFLLYCAALKGIPKKKIVSSLEESVQKCQLQNVRKRIIGKLSKGYRQRVGLAQALISNPEILIFDEPTVGLDPSQVVQVRNLIKELRKDRTIIISTHILTEVEAVCEKVIIIHQGRIVKQSGMDELTSPSAGAVRITLEFKGEKEEFIKACRTIEGVTGIIETSVGSVIVETLSPSEERVRERIFHAAVSSKTTLLEMKKDKVTLESIFLELTQKE